MDDSYDFEPLDIFLEIENNDDFHIFQVIEDNECSMKLTK